VRALLPHEAAVLRTLDAPGEAYFDGETLDAQEALRRAERYDVAPDGSYLMRVTELGRLALRVAQEPRP
jgi:hypothetical protein